VIAVINSDPLISILILESCMNLNLRKLYESEMPINFEKWGKDQNK
jgi:hypothetical protein